MNPCNTRLYCQGGSLFFGLCLRQKVCYPGIYAQNNIHIYNILYFENYNFDFGVTCKYKYNILFYFVTLV